MLFLDFDNFKQINDSRGHAAGDRLLATLGERLSGLLRPMDTVARFGGDEFTFLFEGLSSEREVVLIADRICQAAGLPIEVDGVELTVTVSVGIAMVADPTVTPEAIIREADAAMYRAKERRSLALRAVRRGLAAAGDRADRARGGDPPRRSSVASCACTTSPPCSCTASDEVAGVEALVRWQHPGRGLIAARDFMPLAGDAGLAVPIGRFVLEHALAQLARWRARKPDMTISLNISSPQLRDPDSAVAPDARRSQPPGSNRRPSASSRRDRAGRTIRHGRSSALEKLKATGVRLAIDDFGAGASRSRAPARAADRRAQDPRELRGRPRQPRRRMRLVVGALVELGHALGLDVVAEGVETEAQLEQLRELGCDAAQGYAIGRPVSEEQFEALLLAPAV